MWWLLAGFAIGCAAAAWHASGRELRLRWEVTRLEAELAAARDFMCRQMGPVVKVRTPTGERPPCPHEQAGRAFPCFACHPGEAA